MKVSGMVGKGSLTHNNRNFYAKNVDSSRTEENIIFVQNDLQDVYHKLFDQALEQYNARKKKTRDKIPDYYEHIRTGKQEKLFHEVIFQVGNKDDCGCGSPEAQQATDVLRTFTEDFQSRNPHLIVFNATLHLDEATPHVHIDFVPVATEQKRGLSTRVSMKQALKQQGFTGSSKKQSEWARWMAQEKAVLEQMAQEHGIEIEHGEGGRKHLSLPEYKAAAQALDAVQEQVSSLSAEVDELSEQQSELREEVDATVAAQAAAQQAMDAASGVSGFGFTILSKKKLEETTRQNIELSTAVANLSARNEQLERLVSPDIEQELEHSHRIISKQNEQITALSGELDRIRLCASKQEQTHQKEISTLTAEVSTLRAEQDSLRSSLLWLVKKVQNIVPKFFSPSDMQTFRLLLSAFGIQPQAYQQEHSSSGSGSIRSRLADAQTKANQQNYHQPQPTKPKHRSYYER